MTFSQNVTKIPQDSVVIIKLDVAKKIAKDLVYYDQTKLENLELNKIIGLRDYQIELLIRNDTLNKTQIKNLSEIIRYKDIINDYLTQNNEKLNKELKVRDKNLILHKALLYLSLVATIYTITR